MVESSCWPLEVDGVSAAKWRRRRRLRLWWRHEHQTLAAVLATFQHHSAPWGPKKARTGEEDHEKNYTATIPTHPPPQPKLFSLYEEPGGTRPEALAESWPQERVQRRTVEQIVDFLPVVQILDVLVPQVGASIPAVLEQVNLWLASRFCRRRSRR